MILMFLVPEFAYAHAWVVEWEPALIKKPKQGMDNAYHLKIFLFIIAAH